MKRFINDLIDRMLPYLGTCGLGLIIIALLIGSWYGYFINDQAKPARPEAQWVAPSEKMPELDKSIFGLYKIKIDDKKGKHIIINNNSSGEKYLEAFNIKCTEINWGNGKIDIWWIFDDGFDSAKENLGPPIRWSELPILPDGLMK